MPTVSITGDTVVKIADGQLSTLLGDEVVILGIDESAYYGLSGVGAFIWEHLKIPQRVADLLDAILAEHSVDKAQCEQDLLTLLTDLANNGLITLDSQ